MTWRGNGEREFSPIPAYELDRAHPIDGTGAKEPRDWKRTTLIVGLGTLSWVATYVGMLELIVANIGDLPLSHRAIIGLSVAMLMVMIIWLLDQMFRPQLFLTRAFYVVGYLFLTLISVGFGFGFYWKVFESRGEASRSAEIAVTQVQTSLAGANTRLTQLESTLKQLAAVSVEKAELERTKGTSCPDSRPGDGPRRRMRDDDAQKFAFASELVGNRAGAVRAGMTGLDGDLAKVAANDPSTIDAKSGTRNDFMRQLSRKLEMTTASFNGMKSDPQLQQIRNELADRSTRTTFPDGRGGSISCPDAQLQAALRGAVAAIDQLPSLETPEIAVVEGSEATIEAFRRLTATLAGIMTFKLPPTSDELRSLQKKAVESIESDRQPIVTASGLQSGLASRDYIPLGVAIFVDFCLFLVSLVQRPAGRLSGLMPKMQAAERGPVIDILSRFNDIHRDRNIRENFEIFRHVVFDMNGDYYAAIPLDAPTRLNPQQREELRVEAQLLANLFASFEKEKIFKRTLLPTTSSIQKRLHRQGSKFAAAEAFRVYKFADGAWSDIILGAVMGAARRLDRGMHTRTAAQDGAASLPASSLKAVNDDGPATAPAASTAPVERARDRRDDGGDRDDVADDRDGALNFDDLPRFEASVLTSHPGAQGAGDGVQRQPRRRPSLETEITGAPRARSGDNGFALPIYGQSELTGRNSAEPRLPADPDHVSRFGPYATHYPDVPVRYSDAPHSPRVVRRPPPDPIRAAEASVEVELRPLPATANGWTAADPAGADDQAAARDGGGSRLSMTVSREKAVFSVPVSEAVLPKSLSAALAALSREGDREPLFGPVDAIDVDEAVAIDSNDTAEPANDLAFLSRLAPPAAE